MSDLTEQLRGWWVHLPSQAWPKYCEVCGVKSPCEWNQAMADMAKAADRIDKLEAALLLWASDDELMELGIARRALEGDDE